MALHSWYRVTELLRKKELKKKCAVKPQKRVYLGAYKNIIFETTKISLFLRQKKNIISIPENGDKTFNHAHNSLEWI